MMMMMMIIIIIIISTTSNIVVRTVLHCGTFSTTACQFILTLILSLSLSLSLSIYIYIYIYGESILRISQRCAWGLRSCKIRRVTHNSISSISMEHGAFFLTDLQVSAF